MFRSPPNFPAIAFTLCSPVRAQPANRPSGDTQYPPAEATDDHAACDPAAPEALAADLGAAMVVALVVLLIAQTRARLQLFAEPAGAGIRPLREVDTLKLGAGTAALPRLRTLARALEAQVGRRAQGTLPRYRPRSLPD